MTEPATSADLDKQPGNWQDVVDDLKALSERVMSGEPIKATRVNPATGEQTEVVLQSRPDLDKLAAQLASEILNIRGPDRLERIKAEVKEVLVQQDQRLAAERAQWAIELARATDQRLSAERRVAYLQECIDGWDRQLGLIDSNDDRTIGSEIARMQRRLALLESAVAHADLEGES